jgi:leader peptidase (prepilin peptidase)/N-methyltransferase
MGTALDVGIGAVLGLVIGSFLNVCAWRLPRGEAVWAGRSHCPRCGRTLSPGELLPIVSFLVLRGRCRGCGGAISWRYPALEALCGLAFAAAAWRYGWTAAAARADLIAAVGIVAGAIDLEHRVIPNPVVAAGAAAGALVAACLAVAGAYGAALALVIGLFAAGGAMLLVALLGRGGMGPGDVKLAGAFGLLLGWPAAAWALLYAFVAGAVVGLALVALGRARLKSAMAFGPYLVLGAVAAALVAPGL